MASLREIITEVSTLQVELKPDLILDKVKNDLQLLLRLFGEELNPAWNRNWTRNLGFYTLAEFTTNTPFTGEYWKDLTASFEINGNKPHILLFNYRQNDPDPTIYLTIEEMSESIVILKSGVKIQDHAIIEPALARREVNLPEAVNAFNLISHITPLSNRKGAYGIL